tara:strand:- start:150 stop:380 length:231 start_codon:yes stop_codon:yes gene_type:complete
MMMSEGNLGLIAKGKANFDEVTRLYLWRMRDYTYEIEYSNYVGRSVRVLTSELLEETPFKVALRKFENLVEEVELV